MSYKKLKHKKPTKKQPLRISYPSTSATSTPTHTVTAYPSLWAEGEEVDPSDTDRPFTEGELLLPEQIEIPISVLLDEEKFKAFLKDFSERYQRGEHAEQ